MTADLQTAVAAYREALAEQARAAAELVRARDAIPPVRARLAAAIVAAHGEGVRVAELARITGYGREQVRRILRAAGVPAADDSGD